MFTGLIEAVGELKRFERSQGGASLVIACPAWDVPLVLGESVAVQGACLTVTAYDDTSFTCDILDETLTRTNLSQKAAGAALNLERALKLGDRLGGHMVSGHIDAVGRIAEIQPAGRDRVVTVSCEPEIVAGIVEKGSISIDGISLTVSMVSADRFAVNIIPFSWDHTSLRERRAGDSVNLETDMFGKYVQRYLSSVPTSTGVDLASLASAGFLAVDT
ncbi:MAG: riboflavin synthase [Verrucomicrobia bacterium]|nr:riboflavin synthase [Verrucomicrobiota bacterium]